MWYISLWSYIKAEGIALYERSKCGESTFSVVPTLLWAAGTTAWAVRLLEELFHRFAFRRVPLWEIMFQRLLFVWMIMHCLYFWGVLMTVVKTIVEYYVHNDAITSLEEENYRKLLQQWMIWICGVVPLATYLHTRTTPEAPPLMIWITTSPWQRREMGPYGYYLNRPLNSLQSTTNLSFRRQALTLRQAFSDSKIIIKEPPKKKRISKSI